MDDVWKIAFKNGMEIHDVSKSSVSILLKLNSKCNSKCKYCLSWKTSYDFLNIEYIKKVVNNLKYFKASRLTLSGGEPTLHPNFIDIAKYLDEKDITTNLITNGQFNNFSIWEKYFKNITFSIDTIDRASYKYLRGVDVLETIMINLDRALQSNKNVNINMVLTKQTIANLDNSIEYFLKKGVTHIFLLDLETHLEIEKDIVPNAKKSKHLLKNILDKYPSNVIYNQNIYNSNSDFNCLIPWMHLTIRPNGTVYPCCRLGDDVPGEEINSFCIGNIVSSDINEIWLSYERDMILKSIINKLPEACLLCSIRNYFNDNKIQGNIEWVRM